MKLNRLLGAVTLPLLVAACSAGSDDATSQGGAEADTTQSFLSIPKSEVVGTAGGALKVRSLPPSGTANDSVYIVVNRNQLANKFFMSAFLEKLSPGGVASGAQSTLGTRVITMREQNSKLYFFDAGQTKAVSKVGDQEFVIDAYPVVEPATLGIQYTWLYPKKDWIIIDPGVSQNPLTFVKDFFAAYNPIKFETQLSYQQNFKKLSDGVEFQQVFSGLADVPISDGSTELNQFHAEGTITFSLRKYFESAGFQAPPAQSVAHYFTHETWEGTQLTGTDAITKWNIHPGMAPIKWRISRNVLETEAATGNAYDLVGAIKKGVENWNAVFGYTVFQASLAGPNDRIGDDTLNFIEWDTDTSVPFAFANARSNPNTGEIRGASVYMNAIFFNPGFEDDAADAAASAANAKAFLGRFGQRPQVPSVAWGGTGAKAGCSLFVGDVFGRTAQRKLFGGAKKASQLTATQKTEAVITHTILHEIGHTLGLRHNFKGSLVPDGTAATSVMDYLLDDDSFARVTPGPYDSDAVKYLYGQKPAEPAQTFCTDEDIALDPDCNTFDRTNDPLHLDLGPYSSFLRSLAFSGGYPLDYIGPFISRAGNEVADYTRAGTPSQATDATAFLFEGTAPGAADPNADAVDYISRLFAKRLYVDGPELQGDIVGRPSDVIVPQVLTQLKGVLTNSDGIRTYEARREAVDVLKKVQTDSALATLLAARATIAAGVGALPAAEQNLANDLIAKIDSVTKPYYP